MPTPSVAIAKTWRELKAEGVKRCCATFTNGKRCRRRSVNDEYYCERHVWIEAMAQRLTRAALEACGAEPKSEILDA